MSKTVYKIKWENAHGAKGTYPQDIETEEHARIIVKFLKGNSKGVVYEILPRLKPEVETGKG